MTAAAAGPKIDIDAVQQAIAGVEQGQQQMEGITARILAQSGLSLEVMQAPAGQVTASAFDQLGGGGKALTEELHRLRTDLGTLVTVAQAGSDQATQAARSGLGLAATVGA